MVKIQEKEKKEAAFLLLSMLVWAAAGPLRCDFAESFSVTSSQCSTRSQVKRLTEG